jgi:hypothetical protein
LLPANQTHKQNTLLAVNFGLPEIWLKKCSELTHRENL